jgi:hypothetical protein
MATARADEALVILLGHASRDVVFAAAGALVNVGADPLCRAALTTSSDGPNGCALLVRQVRRAGTSDLALATVASQALYNVLSPFAASQASGDVAACEDAFWSLQLLHDSLEELLEVTDPEDEHGAEFATAGGALHRLTESLLQQRQRSERASEYEELEDPIGHGHK